MKQPKIVTIKGKRYAVGKHGEKYEIGPATDNLDSGNNQYFLREKPQPKKKTK